MNTLQTIKQIVDNHNREIIFSDPVKVKLNPHTQVFYCHGVHSENGVWLMDGQGQWHGPLEENQVNAGLVINSIYQRLKILELQTV